MSDWIIALLETCALVMDAILNNCPIGTMIPGDIDTADGQLDDIESRIDELNNEIDMIENRIDDVANMDEEL